MEFANPAQHCRNIDVGVGDRIESPFMTPFGITVCRVTYIGKDYIDVEDEEGYPNVFRKTKNITRWTKHDPPKYDIKDGRGEGIYIRRSGEPIAHVMAVLDATHVEIDTFIAFGLAALNNQPESTARESGPWTIDIASDGLCMVRRFGVPFYAITPLDAAREAAGSEMSSSVASWTSQVLAARLNFSYEKHGKGVE